MILKILIIFLLFFSVTIYSQDRRVILSEKKTNKRIILFAENTTKDTLNIFFIVTSEGYRKSASKPIIKNILPESKIALITLIELDNKPSSYTYELIINEQENNLSFSFDKKAKDIEKIIAGKLVLFTMDNCDTCELLSKTLESRGVSHRSFNIDKDPILYRQFMAFIEKELTQETRIKFPIIWNKDHTIFGYNDLEIMVNGLVD